MSLCLESNVSSKYEFLCMQIATDWLITDWVHFIAILLHIEAPNSLRIQQLSASGCRTGPCLWSKFQFKRTASSLHTVAILFIMRWIPTFFGFSRTRKYSLNTWNLLLWCLILSIWSIYYLALCLNFPSGYQLFPHHNFTFGPEELTGANLNWTFTHL